MHSADSPAAGAFRLAAGYATAATVWILLSDQLMLRVFGTDPATLSRFGVLKGCAFVGVTSVVLYALLRRLLGRADALHARQRESQNLLEAICESLPDGVVAKDLAGRYLVCNRAAAELLGRSSEAVVGEDDAALFGPQRAAELRAADTRIVEEDITLVQEETSEHPEVALITQVTRGPLRDASGTVFGTFGLMRDITELRSAVSELELHRSRLEELVALRSAELGAAEQRLRMVIESTAEGLIVLDAMGVIRMVNPATTELLGYAPEELLGRNVHAAIHHSLIDGGPKATEGCALMSAIRHGQKCELLNDSFWHRDGHAVPVAAASNPILVDGRVSGAVLSFFDITERQKVEQAREEARAAAEQLARTKSEFLANMSHEIRTPLNGVLGFAQIGLRDNAGNEAVRRTFAHILDSGKLLLTIINDILDFSKIEAGKLAIEAVPVDPHALVDQAVATVRDAAAAKGLALEAETAADLPAACLGDPVRIMQVLLNLLSNAVKFTPAGRVRVHAAREGAALVFSVIDSGIGIAATDIERLFEPFEQADGSTTRRFGGTGLGLTISRRLSEMMGGSLSVQSEPGQGSRFELRVPLRETALPVAHRQPQEVARGPRLAGTRVLAAEDNEVNGLVLEDFLRQEGAQVTMVGNGRLAVDAVARAPGAFDVVLMDVQMPELDGLAATRQLRELAPRLPVIGQTAHALKEEHDKCLAAGMVATVTKPIDIDVLVSQVLQQVHRPGGLATGAAAGEADTASGETGLIDWHALLARFAHRAGFVERLLALALKNTVGKPAQLRALADQRDFAGIDALAHDCKGIAGNLAADGLEDLARRTMNLARAGENGALALARQLADALDGLAAALARDRPAPVPVRETGPHP